MTKFSSLEKNFGLSSEKNLELNSTSREAVIAVESRDHAKNNGVSPKDQMSRENFCGMRKFLTLSFFTLFTFVTVKRQLKMILQENILVLAATHINPH